MQKQSAITITDAAAADLPAINVLLSDCALPVPEVEEKVSFLVARIDGTVCGCLGWERYDSIVLLRSLAVASASRKQGIASHLVQTAIDNLTAQGAREFYLLTETAAGFADRFGFHAIDRCSLPSALQRSTQISTGCCSGAKSMQLKR